MFKKLKNLFNKTEEKKNDLPELIVPVEIRMSARYDVEKNDFHSMDRLVVMGPRKQIGEMFWMALRSNDEFKDILKPSILDMMKNAMDNPKASEMMDRFAEEMKSRGVGPDGPIKNSSPNISSMTEEEIKELIRKKNKDFLND